ncbi:MAG: DNA gyrase inhibitor YacG [Sedimentisphaerales bacterium]|jgi:endogenous inhibitor of DNA gyrase (YacG/DUF329 family)
MEYRCPVCHKTFQAPGEKPVERTPFFPFCCERCKLIDLGAWLDAEYRITSEPESGESEESPEDVRDDSEEE